MAVLEELSASVQGVVDRVGPAVVGLGRGWGRGSGVVTAAGRAVTNAHNLRGDEVTVAFADGRVERGESGGPLVDPEGRLLGLNTVRMEGGLILAIAADESFTDRVEALSRGETVSRPRLGVAIAPARVARRLRRAVGLPERDGLLVHGVQRDGPAARAGIQKGDLLVAAGERDLMRVDDLHAALDSTPAGADLALTAVRGV